MVAPLLIKGIRALRTNEPDQPAPAPPELPPFFSVEMPWVNQRLVDIDSNVQTIMHQLTDERGRSRVLDILETLQRQGRRIEALEAGIRARRRNSSKST